jgi:Flp pilus assembly protein TadB
MPALWSTLFAVSFASGLNIYATILTLGLLNRFQIVELPGQLDVVSSTPVIAGAAILYALEFIADKIPYIDSVWDVIHSVIRPIGGAVLAYSAVGRVDPGLQMLAALVGGSVALTSHAAKASTRAVANLSPEPFSNWILSFGEDLVAVGLVSLAVMYPWIALVVVLALMCLAVVILVKFSRLIRGLWRRPGLQLQK